MNIEKIKNIFLSENFEITHETSKKIEFTSSEIDDYFYLNISSKQSPSSVIINPRFKKKLSRLSQIPGVMIGKDWYHSSNMRNFPKRMNTGKNPIHYGIPASFVNETGFRSFIQILKEEANDDPYSDILAADQQLKSVSETERDALVKARVGQGPFRKSLIDYWKCCAVTGLSKEELLTASHAKPWRDATNFERLDVFNGLLLSPNLDKAFDKGYISFNEKKQIIISPLLSNNEATYLGIHKDLQLKKIDPKHVPYLKWHSENVFKI